MEMGADFDITRPVAAPASLNRPFFRVTSHELISKVACAAV